jgi:hypothetical protein
MARLLATPDAPLTIDMTTMTLHWQRTAPNVWNASSSDVSFDIEAEGPKYVVHSNGVRIGHADNLASAQSIAEDYTAALATVLVIN